MDISFFIYLGIVVVLLGILIYILFRSFPIVRRYAKPSNWLQVITLIKNKIKSRKKQRQGQLGFKKKLNIVVCFLVGGLFLVAVFYGVWFYQNREKIQNFENTIEISRSDVEERNHDAGKLLIIKPDSKSATAINSHSEGSYLRSILSVNNLFLFFEEKDGFLGLFFAFYGLITIIIGFYDWSKYELYSLLHHRNKDKIKILDKFSSRNELIGTRSIYQSIIDVLKRCRDAQFSATNNGEIELNLLLCSPLLDFPGRVKEIDDWGQEFTQLITSLANSNRVGLNLYHLPNMDIAGINPLKSFTEVLANFSPANPQQPGNNFNAIWKRTESILTGFKLLDADPNMPVQINRTILTDIPFQIIYYKSPRLNEVVVSFAGRKILEDQDNKAEPYGFHSVDIDVVDAFEKIFKSYVKEKKRSPIRPQHTRDIIKRITDAGAHDIEQYLSPQIDGSFVISFDIGEINLTIQKENFSPAFANSSKFTSLVLKSSIVKEDRVLEIGAGSGVQSIVAYKTLTKLQNPSPVVFAAEMFDSAFENLTSNLEKNLILYKAATGTNPESPGVFPLKAELRSECTAYLIDDNRKKFLKDENGKKRPKEGGPRIIATSEAKESFNEELNDYEDEITDGKLIILGPPEADFTPPNLSFSLVVADLPYVDTCAIGELDRAFFDPDHNAHKTLFLYFQKSSHIAPNAKLITSFSSLGGEEDIIRFELLIADTGLVVLNKNSFTEDGYQWIVYTLMRQEDYMKIDRFWWNYLNCNKS